MRVRLPGPVDPVRTLRRLAVFSYDATMRQVGDAVVCAFGTPLGAATVRYRPIREQEVGVTAWGPGAEHALAAAPDHVGAHDPAEEFQTVDPVIAPLAKRLRGLRFGRSRRLVEGLIPIILSQKVTGAGASRSWRQLLLRYGEVAPGPFPGLRVPPAPARLRELAYYDFHPLGVERRRAQIILAVVRRAPRVERLVDEGPDAAEAKLLAMAGIGPWTTASVRSAVFGDADAVPVGDYNLPHLVSHAFTGEPRGNDERMLELLEPFRPHRARVLALLRMSGVSPPRFGPRLAVRDIGRS